MKPLIRWCDGETHSFINESNCNCTMIHLTITHLFGLWEYIKKKKLSTQLLPEAKQVIRKQAKCLYAIEMTVFTFD